MGWIVLIVVVALLLSASGVDSEKGFNEVLLPLIGLAVACGIIGAISGRSGSSREKSKPSYAKQVSMTEKRLFDKGMTYHNGYEYERYVAYLLERKGYSNVHITQETNDYGADIICYNGKVKTAVQCKFYSKPVGYEAVQNVVGGMLYYGCGQAIVVTNSTYTRQAIDGAKRIGVELWEKVK